MEGMEKVNNSNDDEEELDGKRAVTYQVSFRFILSSGIGCVCLFIFLLIF